MRANGSHTGPSQVRVVVNADDRQRVDKALDRLKSESHLPGFREVIVTYHQGRYRVRGRETWEFEET